MKFCFKTETRMLQVNANLTVSIEQLIINKKISLAKEYYRKQKRSSFHF